MLIYPLYSSADSLSSSAQNRIYKPPPESNDSPLVNSLILHGISRMPQH
jgi:hypothetical protein